MKLRKYKISNKPLKVETKKVDNQSDHALDAISYTCRPYNMPNFPSDEYDFAFSLSNYQLINRSFGIPFNEEQFNEFRDSIKQRQWIRLNNQIPLEEQLKQALQSEDYEKAAELRDKIQKKV